MIIGIDPGKKGGAVAITKSGKIAYTIFSDSGVINYIMQCGKGGVHEEDINHIGIERAQAMPKQGGVSMFNYGVGYGIIQGLCIANNKPYTLIPPKDWQKEMLQGTPSAMDTKKRAEIVCLRLWPNYEWPKTPKSKKYYDGIMDAALIAEYMRRKLK